MSEQRIVQLRKKGGLDAITVSKNGGKVTPKLFRSKDRNPNNEGTYEGDYKGKSMLDAKHFLSPMWNDMKRGWSWAGTPEDLARLVKAMQLRYPKGHKLEGEIIKNIPEGEAQRLTNRLDEVFTHPDLYGRYFMESSRIGLDLADPRQEFMYLCYKGDTFVDDKSSDKKVNNVLTAAARYEIISPRKESKKKKDTSSKRNKALSLLDGMDGDELKMRSIAVIMSLPGYSPKTELEGVYLLLQDQAAENVQMSSRFDKTFQDRFIELASMTDEELKVTKDIIDAKNAGILASRPGHYLFNGERIDGYDSELQIIAYFKNPVNQDRYLQLLDLLNSK